MEFEERRIYIIDEILANPIGTLAGKNPQYVAKQIHPNEYGHNTSMERNGVEIFEFELLSLLGLEEQRNEILNKHRKKLSEYKRKLEEYEKGPKYRIVPDGYYTPLETVVGEQEYLCYVPLIFSGTFLSLLGFDGGVTKAKLYGLMSFGIILIDMNTRIPTQKKISIPPPSKPKIAKTLSNNQIRSLVKTYNLNLHKKIKIK